MRSKASSELWSSPFITRRYRYAGHVDGGEEQAFNCVMSEISGGAVLDIGIGAGRTSAILSESADQYVGVDFSPGMVRLARRRHPRLDLRVADARDLSAFAPGSFDVTIFSFNGIDLVRHEERGVVLEQMMRALKPGGHIVLSSLNLHGVSFRESPMHRRARFRANGETGLKPAVRATVDRLRSVLATPASLYHFAANAPEIRWGEEWAEWPLQGHDFRFIGHFASLRYLRRELETAGLDIVGAWDDTGETLSLSEDSCQGDYMYFVASKK